MSYLCVREIAWLAVRAVGHRDRLCVEATFTTSVMCKADQSRRELVHAMMGGGILCAVAGHLIRRVIAHRVAGGSTPESEVVALLDGTQPCDSTPAEAHERRTADKFTEGHANESSLESTRSVVENVLLISYDALPTLDVRGICAGVGPISADSQVLYS